MHRWYLRSKPDEETEPIVSVSYFIHRDKQEPENVVVMTEPFMILKCEAERERVGWGRGMPKSLVRLYEIN